MRQRWPPGSEAIRIKTIEYATDARELLGEARKEMRRNPLLAEVMIADAITCLEAIHRFMVEAKQGAEPPTTKGEEG
jgi:hypothetical protein